MAWRLATGLLLPRTYCCHAAARPSAALAISLPGGLSEQWRAFRTTTTAANQQAVEETASGGRDGPLPTEEDRAKEFREVMSRKDSIRMSPWKINLLARQIRGLPVVEALLQLQLSRKQKGPPLVGKVIQNATNLASIRYDLNPEDLYVAEAFINRGHVQKGLMIHGRGRHGLRRRAYSHVVVKVREIDFESKIREADNRFQKARWTERRRLAEEVKRARQDRNDTGATVSAAAQ